MDENELEEPGKIVGMTLVPMSEISQTECIQIQLHGREACKDCAKKGIHSGEDRCTGRHIIEHGTNKFGWPVPLGDKLK